MSRRNGTLDLTTLTPEPGPTLGAKIRAAREARRMTQEGLAKAAGVSRSSVGNIETGRHSQTMDTVGKVALALDIDTGSLVSGETRNGESNAVEPLHAFPPRDPEVVALESVLDAVAGLDDAGRGRLLAYLVARFGD